MNIPTSKHWFGICLLSLLTGFTLLSTFAGTNCLAAQTEEVEAAEAVQVPDASSARPVTPAANNESESDGKPTAAKAPQVSDQYAQLHLRDGSIIGGEIEAKSIDVKTNFGMLTVPIARVVRIYPGLKSTPEIGQRIAKLVEDLGDRESTMRDAAQNELVAMGIKIHNILREYDGGGNRERKKRLAQIQSDFSELLAEEMEGNSEGGEFLSYDDRIVTANFSIIGKIQQEEFQVVSKFGDLNVKLADVKLADRLTDTSRPETRKSVSVAAMAFFQKTPKSTGIRVKKGDKITIRADGVVQWTNWNTSSTPEGLTNRSNWNGINSGKLVARIGTDDSNCVAIGSKGDFIAKLSGTLYLGVAMRDSYANNSSYRWAGEYKARIRVRPKTE